jgi:hypothetical protein
MPRQATGEKDKTALAMVDLHVQSETLWGRVAYLRVAALIQNPTAQEQVAFGKEQTLTATLPHAQEHVVTEQHATRLISQHVRTREIRLLDMMSIVLHQTRALRLTQSLRAASRTIPV